MSPLERDLAALHQPLLRFARQQLRDDAAAEDAVSATLLAILEKPGAFQGASSLRTYATGILKHKLIDHLRRFKHEVTIAPQEDQSIDEALDALFDASGHWCDRPAAWAEPDSALEQRELAKALERCLASLPARLARVLTLREWLDQDTPAICSELEISSANCHVMLYRARMLMRECLDTSWFRTARS